MPHLTRRRFLAIRPKTKLTTSRSDNPIADFDNEAGIFRYRDEITREEKPSLWMMPAD